MDWEGFFTQYRKPGFIPGYEIVNKLGSGVFGEVYKARKESIGKFYAIKFLKISDEKVSEAIFKELDTLRYFAQIDHPNLVSIEDKGEVMGIPYIVMGYAGDETLKKRLASGPLRGKELHKVFRQIASGVSALHGKSIIHFDLKPANIFMKENHARVGDYGLSKLVSESANTMSIGRGTPYYMAPEMLRRKGDHRSDIYSIGVILYEMVTGEVPFKGDSEWEVLRKHESEAVKLPKSTPAPYRGIIERCMKKDPEERFASVAEILAILDGQPATSSIPMPPPPPAPDTASVTVPPPLPHQRVGADQARSGLASAAAWIRSRPGAEKARRDYQAKLGGRAQGDGDGGANGRTLGSFYVEFEDSAPVHHGREAAQAAKEAASAAAKAATASARAAADVARRSGTPFVFLPFVWLFKGIGWVFSTIWRGLAVFFRNFLRYSVVLAVTAGLAFLIHAALREFRTDFF